jgi:hypothetical protein
MSTARVHVIGSLGDFQTALVEFKDRAKEALASNALALRRAADGLEENTARWKQEVRKADEAVVQARMELSRRKMMRIGDRPVDTTDQEKAYRIALARLEHAREKLAACKRWQRQLPDAVEEYQGRARPFHDVVEQDLPRMVAFLEAKLAALAAYQAVPGTS